MLFLWEFVLFIVIGLNIDDCCTAQTSNSIYIRSLSYNISSTAYTSSLLRNTVTDKNYKCYSQCHVTPGCVALLYDSQTTECRTFSGLLNDPPLELSNRMEKSYYVTGEQICSDMGYIFEKKIPFCYKIHHNKTTHSVAKSECSKEGARLIQIDSPNKQAVVESFPLDESVVKYGIDGQLISDVWKFSSGSSITQFYWRSGDPTLNRNHLSVNSLYNNKWDDVLSSADWGYICERML